MQHNNYLDTLDNADKALISDLLIMGIHSDDWCSWTAAWCYEDWVRAGVFWLRQHDTGEFSIELTWAGVMVAEKFAYELEPAYEDGQFHPHSVPTVVEAYIKRLHRLNQTEDDRYVNHIPDRSFTG